MNIRTMPGDAGETYALTIDRLLKAPREKVFAAWTDPALLAGWWGPEGMHAPLADLDVREGGTWRTIMESPTGEQHIARGTYREIDPPARLVFTWAWEQGGSPGPETLVEIDFEEADGGTMMRFRHSGFDTSDAAEHHNMGWTSSFVCLETALAGTAA